MKWTDHYQEVLKFIDRNQVAVFDVTQDTVGPVLFAHHRSLNPHEFAKLTEYAAWLKSMIDAEGLEGDLDSA